MTYTPRRLVTGGRVYTIFTPNDLYSTGAFAAAQWVGVGSSAAWPAANRALLFPFGVPTLSTAYKALVGNGSTISGNVDVGIYDAAGALLVSSGSTVRSGTTQIQAIDIADTTLSPGVLYYLAIVVDDGSHVWRIQAGARNMDMMGVREKAASFPLPNPLTGTAVITTSYYPTVGLELASR